MIETQPIDENLLQNEGNLVRTQQQRVNLR